MLITKSVFTKWNSKTKKYYESLGYQFTKMGDSFEVKVEHLKTRSMEYVEVECDYCKKKFSLSWCKRNVKNEDAYIKNDCCYDCHVTKIKEIFLLKYGATNIMDVEGAKEKRDKTVMELYGVENVFQSSEIKDRIKETMLEKYGNESFTKTDLYKEKSEATSLEKYGETNWMKTEKYKEMYRGEKSPVWKGGIHEPAWDRLQPIYKEWRNKVFGRDRYTCQKCKIKKNYVEAHHIFNWNDNPDKRYDIDNGITFCLDCHVSFHRKYGKKFNTLEQLTEFLNET